LFNKQLILFNLLNKVYPSLGTTGSKQRKPKLNSQASIEVNNDSFGEKKSTRKRKLKPHVAHYLQPSVILSSEQKAENVIDSEIASNLNQEKHKTETTKKRNKKDTLLNKLIEKNIKKQESLIKSETAKTKESIDKMDGNIGKVTNKKRKSDSVGTNDADDDDDDDYKVEENVDDEDEDFKIKCEKNLKLSKKLKKNSIKQQKEQLGDLSDNSNFSKKQLQQELPLASSSATNATVKSKYNKKLKKGYATTKQRLSKLLKINRIVNI
jgi:hypothetical protein